MSALVHGDEEWPVKKTQEKDGGTVKYEVDTYVNNSLAFMFVS